MAPETRSTQSVAVVKTSEKYSFIFAPGKQGSKQGNVRVNLFFDKPFYNAGGHLSGRLELTCASEELVRLGQVVVEVTGFEDVERSSKNTSLRRRIFYKSRLVLQEPGSPSDAVKPNTPSDADGYYPAKAGKTTFPFSIELSNNLPSSYVSRIGGVRYVVSGAVAMKSNDRKENLAHNRFAQVYEKWTEFEVANARTIPAIVNNSEEVRGETKERISMSAELTRGMVAAGGLIYVQALISNLGKKTVGGLKLSLWQQISGNHDLTRTDSGGRLSPGMDNRILVTEAVYQGHDWAVPAGENRGSVVALGVPPSCYSLRNTSLIQVSYEVQIDLITPFCKWKPLRLPIYIAHPSSWSDTPPNIFHPAPRCFGPATTGDPDISTIDATARTPFDSSVPVRESPAPNTGKNPRRASILTRKESVRHKVRPSSIGTLCEPAEMSRMILRVTNPDSPVTFTEPDPTPQPILADFRKRASTLTGLGSRPSVGLHRRQSTLGGLAPRRPPGSRAGKGSGSFDSSDDTTSLIEIGDRILTQHGLRPSFEGVEYAVANHVETPPRRSVTIQQLEALQEQMELPETAETDSETNSEEESPSEDFHRCSTGPGSRGWGEVRPRRKRKRKRERRGSSVWMSTWGSLPPGRDEPSLGPPRRHGQTPGEVPPTYPQESPGEKGASLPVGYRGLHPDETPPPAASDGHRVHLHGDRDPPLRGEILHPLNPHPTSTHHHHHRHRHRLPTYLTLAHPPWQIEFRPSHHVFVSLPPNPTPILYPPMNPGPHQHV
ncbi:hypothetical protein K493DRAFT_340790 [Basidiobolus meristosporus CBS 931.73]|uniref:Arrestin C-terminal-like domain-containing protein n=1 Tax=Basidiobolus meristosporus CBS 931.73 TaxID=1314790 RepID=A0A1Y1XV97_9FUNG|nr:hypothetical protein K493DRAFT_340790 [Basidiobolus meristosporus CBS 931.73]|eukprot:ORX89204.1 hypothetical protein K493DRAFT_340790 [Basidiobolus meristosporus CBS 931.73]